MKNLLLFSILILFLRIPLLSQTLSYDPDLWMPDTIPVALGNSFELYNNNIAFVKLNNEFVNFKWESKIGASDSSKWFWTADRTGNFNLVLKSYNKDILIDSVHTILKVVDKVRISPKNLLAIGNSLTQGGFEYQFAQISKELDFELLPFGTRGSITKHEGHSGWLFESFLGSKSPFFIDDRINFKQYIEINNLPDPDIIRISLGINDCYLNSSHPLDSIMSNAKHLIDNIYNNYPNSIIIIALPSTCESTGSGWLKSYANLDNFERYQLHMRGLWKRIDAKYGCGRYKQNIIVSYDGLCIDRKNGYPQNNGVHPNQKGYTQLAKGFSNTLNNYEYSSLGHISSGLQPKKPSHSEPYFTFERNNNGVELREKGKPVFFYQSATKSKDGKYLCNNYLHPLYSLTGDTLTEEFPADHPFHRGIFWAWHQIYIGGKSVGDGWIMENIEQEITDVQTTRSGGNAQLKLNVFWKSPLSENKKPFLNEQTSITVHPVQNNIRKIDFAITLKALVPDLEIGGSDDEKGYGGFSARLKRPSNLTFTSAKGPVTPQNLQIESGPWMDFSAPFGKKGEISGVAILCHPKTPNYPAPWILRSETSMQNIVFPGKNRIQLPVNKPVVLYYRLIIHNGNAGKIDINKLQTEYGNY